MSAHPAPQPPGGGWRRWLGEPSPTNLLRMPPRGSPHTSYPAPDPDRTAPVLRHLSVVGMTTGLVMLWVALTPSLLPRAWWMTAVNVGTATTFGYAVGDVLGRVASWLARRTDVRVTLNARADWAFRTLWTLLLCGISVVAWAYGVRQQGVIAELTQARSGGQLGQLLGLVGGLCLFAVLLLLGRAVLSLWRGVRHLVRPVLPRVVAPVVAAVLVLVLLGLLGDQVLYRQGMNWALGRAQQLNAEPPPGRVPPTEAERSGSPASGEAWETLGRDGQSFVADGPRAADIERATGRPALEPVRAYAGKAEHDEVRDAARAAVAELARAGGLERAYVHVTTTTGTGFVQEWSVESVEFLTGGDVATVSMQYSYFSSALAYVSDRRTPPQAGAALLEAVEAELATLPQAQRPRLLVSGESLGSYGAQGAFTSAEDLLERVDGAVFTGTPRFTPLWAGLTEGRRPGSPEIAPVVDNGRHVRFVTRPEELTADIYGGPYVPWEEPRVVYGQHPSDPIVWWSPELLYREPDWLREKAGRDVSPALDWVGFVTFWQIASDMPLSVDLPPGHGHEYKDEMVPIWAAVLDHDRTDDLAPITAAIQDLVIPR